MQSSTDRAVKPFRPAQLPLQSLDWSRFIPLIGSAHKELAHFDALLRNIPDAWLFLSPLTTQEAVLSSRIEGTQATLEEVLHFQAEGKTSAEKHDDIQEVLNYRKAVDTAFARLNSWPLSGRLLKEAHKILLSGARGKSRHPSHFRTGQVYIGKLGTTIERASYIPPEAQHIPKLFSSLERYINSEEPDPLVQLAVIHAQFEIIHPFWDGNGRIGRLLMPLFLYCKKMITAPCFYLSEYLEKHRSEYYDRLNRISRDGDWEQWVEFFLRAISEQSHINAGKAQAILDLKENTALQIQEITHSQYTTHMTNFLFARPIFSSVNFRAESSIPRPSTTRLLKLLVKGAIIKKTSPGKGRRPSMFEFPPLMQIIAEQPKEHIK